MEPLARAIEAALFAAEEPLDAAALGELLGGADTRDVTEALEALAEHYRTRGIHLVERATRWHFETAPDLAHLLRRTREQVRRLSRARPKCWRSSPITSRSAGPRSRRSAGSRRPRGRSMS